MLEAMLIYAALIIVVGALAGFLGYRYNQYKDALAKKRQNAEPTFHPAFYNPFRTLSGATRKN